MPNFGEQPTSTNRDRVSGNEESAESTKKQLADALVAEDYAKVAELGEQMKSSQGQKEEFINKDEEEAYAENAERNIVEETKNEDAERTREKEEAEARAKGLEDLKLKDETESAEKAEEILKKINGETETKKDQKKIQEIKEKAYFQSRNEYEEKQYNFAEEKNKCRTLAQKLFFKNKVSGMDIMIEEALKMDQEMEKLIANGKADTFTEAIQILEKGKKDTEKQDKYAELSALEIVRNLENGAISKASSIALNRMYGKEAIPEARGDIKKYIAPYVKEKIIYSIKNKNARGLVQLLKNDFGEYIKPEDLKEMPQDVLKSPEIMSEVNKEVISCFDPKEIVDPKGKFEFRIREYTRLGLITYEEAINLPGVRKKAEKEAISWFEFSEKPEVIKGVWEKIEEMGVLKRKDITQLPAIKEEAKYKLESKLEYLGDKSLSFNELKDFYMENGIINQSDLRQIKRDSEKYIRIGKNFRMSR